MTAELEDVPEELREAVAAALAAAGVESGHLSLELVGPERIAELNEAHRGKAGPTDVLSFPIDETEPVAGPRELGDVVICPEHTTDLTEAAVHGVLHLCGYDHETDDGEMLALQGRVLEGLRNKADASSASRPGASDGRASPSLTKGPARAPVGASDDFLVNDELVLPSGAPGRAAEEAPAGISPGRAAEEAPAGISPGRAAEEAPELFSRAGFIGLAGRPNVGKSTLANAIVGSKVAIVSDRPQTTRRAVRGIATDLAAGWQMVLVDMPGVQKPRDSLTARMQARVERELADSDAVVLVVNGEQGLGPGDRFIARVLLESEAPERPPVICAVNKIDRLSRGETVEVLSAAAGLEIVDEVFPVSAKTGEGVGALIARLTELLPEGPFMYPPEDRSDLPPEVHLAELIREQVLRRTREEIPHAVEVKVLEIDRERPDLIRVVAEVWVETRSQKGILIGKGGRMIRELGTRARAELERDLGARVHLELEVRVRSKWRRDEGLLDRLGIE